MNYAELTRGIEINPDGKREEIAIITWHSFWRDQHQPISKKAWEEIGKLMGWKI